MHLEVIINSYDDTPTGQRQLTHSSFMFNDLTPLEVHDLRQELTVLMLRLEEKRDRRGGSPSPES